MRMDVSMTNLFTNWDKRCQGGHRTKGQTLCSKCAGFDGNTLFKCSIVEIFLVGMAILPIWHGMKYYTFYR